MDPLGQSDELPKVYSLLFCFSIAIKGNWLSHPTPPAVLQGSDIGKDFRSLIHPLIGLTRHSTTGRLYSGHSGLCMRYLCHWPLAFLRWHV